MIAALTACLVKIGIVRSCHLIGGVTLIYFWSELHRRCTKLRVRCSHNDSFAFNNMTSLLNLQEYAPFSVALTGLFTFAGLWGLGTAILWFIRLRLMLPGLALQQFCSGSR